MLVEIGLVAGFAVCAVMAIRATNLLNAALWLALLSALVALSLYFVGAVEIAVIELSVGAGLVTVLLVLAIAMTTGDLPQIRAHVPRWTAIFLVFGTFALVLWQVFPAFGLTPPADTAENTFRVMFWEQRSADVLLQVVLIFVGLLTVLYLLAIPSQKQGLPLSEVEAAEQVIFGVLPVSPTPLHTSKEDLYAIDEAFAEPEQEMEPVP